MHTNSNNLLILSLTLSKNYNELIVIFAVVYLEMPRYYLYMCTTDVIILAPNMVPQFILHPDFLLTLNRLNIDSGSTSIDSESTPHRL